jgi:hypothetical protein
VVFLELTVGPERAQAIIDKSGVASAGAYSRVGHYDYQELIQLLTESVASTNHEAEYLLTAFSDHLFGVFKRDYQVFFEGVSSAAQMLSNIDDHIHVEVKKLYPDAELPKFVYTESDDEIILEYTSPRPLAAVADALVGACIKYFGNKETVIHRDISEDQCSATFVIQVN